jgi:glycosyltransferase involved in cell wall biosynthesis
MIAGGAVPAAAMLAAVNPAADRLRILHAPLNIAGGPGNLSAGLNAIGCESRLMVFHAQPFRDGSDINLHLPTSGGPRVMARRLPRQLAAFARTLPDYDVFHYHAGTLIPKRINLPLLGALGKGRVIQFWGSDLRDQPAAAVDYALRHADAAIVGSYHILPRAPRDDRWPPYRVVPPGMDLALWTPHYPDPGETIRIVHAPSRRARKGTDAVLDAIATLKAEGAPVDLDLIENTPNAEARERYAAADVIIDQLGVGWYGLFAIESMALGKPVVVRLDREPLRQTEEAFGVEAPMINADRDDLVAVLRDLIRDPQRLGAIGRASRAYVEEVHAHTKTAERTLAVYRGAGIAGEGTQRPRGRRRSFAFR